MLLMPEIVDARGRLPTGWRSMPTRSALRPGLERFGPGAVAVRETPAMLGEVDAAQLVRDLADEIAEHATRPRR
jgi:DNA mismatch repair protein MutL